MGPFTLRIGGCLTGVRWVAGSPSVRRCDGGVLEHALDPRSQPFLRACLERTRQEKTVFDVHVLLPTAHRRLGAYSIGESADPSVLRLLPVEQPPQRGVCTSKFDALRERWRLDVADAGVVFPDHALLHHAFADDAYQWVGGRTHRLGRACLLDWRPDFPDRAAFRDVRAMLRTYQYALVLLYGSVQIHAILFHPTNGQTTRVRFTASGGGFGLGEPGDGDEPE